MVQVLFAHGSPEVPPVRVGVQLAEGDKPIPLRTLLVQKPPGEPLDRRELTVARADAQPTAKEVLQPLDGRTRITPCRSVACTWVKPLPRNQTCQLCRLVVVEGLDQFFGCEPFLTYGKHRSRRGRSEE